MKGLPAEAAVMRAAAERAGATPEADGPAPVKTVSVAEYRQSLAAE